MSQHCLSSASLRNTKALHPENSDCKNQYLSDVAATTKEQGQPSIKAIKTQDGAEGISYVDAVIIYEVLKNTFFLKKKAFKKRIRSVDKHNLSEQGRLGNQLMCAHAHRV